MASRTPRDPRNDQHPAAGSDPGGDLPTVLVACASRLDRERLAAQLVGAAQTTITATAGHALDSLASTSFDAVIIDDTLPDASAVELSWQMMQHDPSIALIVRTQTPTLELAAVAMRSGACDVIDTKLTGTDLVLRLAEALRRTSLLRARDERSRQRVQRLLRLCRHLSTAREEVARQVGSLCNDLAGAYRDLTEKMVTSTVSSEFSAIVRQELDLEDLLRTVLEYVLAKVGATNAAIFLPASSGDYTLGAYVNYDCPKDTSEVLFDHLADALAPKFAGERMISTYNTASDLTRKLGDHAQWISDSALMVAPCRAATPGQPEECLAIIALFRDRRSPFGEDLTPLMRIISDLFARQLARVIHCHHRHLPKEKWGMPGSAFTSEGSERDDIDDIDLAA
ncbi:MAG: hypothetical protein KGS45_09610 [Planctomycetes bacterium]|nr:hypothetical protein [Planctomycetota bacterium]